MLRKIICIGGANIDFKLKSYNALLLNTSNPVSSTNTFGGVARNVAHNLAQVTSNVYLQCLVGDDDSGHSLLQHIQALGVNTQYSRAVNGKRTSQYHALLNEQGELFMGLADMGIYDDIGSDFVTSSWDDWTEDSLIFLDTNLPASLIELILTKAASAKFKVCIDPVSAEKSKKIPSSLKSIYLLKPDLFEASALTGLPIDSVDDCIKAGLELKRRGAQNIVITLGKSGYVLVNDSQQIHIPAEKVNQISDVSGAGDSFIAGILYGLQQNKSILESCRIGARAASQTIQSVDSVSVFTL